jgi:RNA polymerase sigma factor for flagellar operon FliA
LLLDNLGVLERVVAFVCRRHRLDASECEDFASVVKVKLLEDDCAILRKFEGRSKLSTFLTVVVHRMMLDQRVRTRGKWHASAEAQRRGPVAVELERLLHRDGRSAEEAVSILAGRFDVDRDALVEMAKHLPDRVARPRAVPIEEAESIADGNDSDAVLHSDRMRLSQQVSLTMNECLRRLNADDRLILQLRFESEMTVAQIARAMQIDQRVLYRRIDHLLRDLRAALERLGIARADIADLIGRDSIDLHFHLRNAPARPSTNDEGGIAATGKETSS